MNPTEALDRLHRAGWSAGEVGVLTAAAPTGPLAGTGIHCPNKRPPNPSERLPCRPRLSRW
jgi:hypothetical protein